MTSFSWVTIMNFAITGIAILFGYLCGHADGVVVGCTHSHIKTGLKDDDDE